MNVPDQRQMSESASAVVYRHSGAEVSEQRDLCAAWRAERMGRGLMPASVTIGLSILSAVTGFTTVTYAVTGHVWQALLSLAVSIASGWLLRAGILANKRDREEQREFDAWRKRTGR